MKCRSAGWLVLLIIPGLGWVPDAAANTAAASSPIAAGKPAPKGKIVDLQFKVLDLVFNDGGVGGSVADIQIKETATEIRIELAADVLFEFDKAVIQPKAEQTLKQAAAVISENASDSLVRIEGHSDAKGDDNYNQKLSERRAEAVKNWFANAGGLKSIEFRIQGLGEQHPVAPNAKIDGSDDPEGRQKNRRVEIIVKKG